MEKPEQAKYPLAGKRSLHPVSLVDFGPDTLGNRPPVIIAGISMDQNYDRMSGILQSVADSGVKHVFYRKCMDKYVMEDLTKTADLYTGMTEKLKRRFGLYHICEIISPRDIHHMDMIADAWKLTNSSMANYQLLKALASIQKPVILSKGILATVDEWLLAAEYLLNGSNDSVILGAGGIRSLDPMYAEILDLNAVLMVKAMSHLPVIADIFTTAPCNGWIPVFAKSLVMAGIDGMIIDVIGKGENTGGNGALHMDDFEKLVIELKQMNEFQ